MTTYQATFRFVGTGAAAITPAALAPIFAATANVTTADVVVAVTHVVGGLYKLNPVDDP
jgi:hypothetical protein